MKIELKVMDDGFVNRYDPNSHRNYACVEYSAMGAIWLIYFFLTIIGTEDQ